MKTNPIPLSNLNIQFKINSITASKKANQILFSKCTGEFSRQFKLTEINTRKTEAIKKETEKI